MDVDRGARKNGDATAASAGRPELKIKGQAEVERKKNKGASDASGSKPDSGVDLERRENELKEKALRNKVVKSRKSS